MSVFLVVTVWWFVEQQITEAAVGGRMDEKLTLKL